jgi:group I intron endonuclease
MSQDFNKAKIYKITNDYNDDVYVGSTCNTLVKRFSQHKCHAPRAEYGDRSLYKLMNQIGDTRFRIELIEDYPCEDKYQLRQREGHFTRLFGTLNMNIPGRPKKETDKEYQEKNKEKIKEYKEKNKEKFSSYNKEYKEKNKEKIDKQNQEYRDCNKEKIKERNMKIITCVCGCNITFGSKQRHEKTQKHIKLVQSVMPSYG